MTTARQSPDPPSRNVFTSKPFRISVAVVVLLCVGLFAFKLIKDNTTLSFSFVLDGKPLPVGTALAVQVDGQPFISGLTITPGSHKLTADLQIAEPFERRVWVFFGNKNLGVLPLDSTKGSLLVSVTPSPASVILRRGTEAVGNGDAPLTVEKLPLGNYELEIKRGEYKETRPVKIEGRQRTEVKIDLNLGGVNLSSDPADAEYQLSGNGRQWDGKLPILIDEVPGGDYRFSARRKGWEVNTTVSVNRGVRQTNRIEFPYGSLEVSSDPVGLKISTNGVEIGKTPLTLQELKPGQYKLAITDGENDLMADVSVAPKEAAKHVFAFHYGAVQLSSIPAGATVFRKGKEVGKTPLRLNHIPAGEAMVELRLHGYVSTNFVIQAVGGVTTDSSAKLISEQYLTDLRDARHAVSSSPPDYPHALESISDALKIYPDDAVALQLHKDYEFRLLLSEAHLSSNDLDTKLAKINAALVLKPTDSEAVNLKQTVADLKMQRDRAAAAQAEQLSAERRAAAGREFNQIISVAVQQERNNYSDMVESQTWEWKGRLTPLQARDALLRSVERCSPKWRVAGEKNFTPDATLIYLRPKGFNLCTADLMVQICQLPNNTLDVRAKMVDGLLTVEDQASYKQSEAQKLGRQFQDFRSQYSSALEAAAAAQPAAESAK